MKRKLLLPVISLLLGAPLTAQDIHFSLYAEAPSIINPALAGVTYNTRVIGNFKDQWSSVASRYRTIGVSFEQTIKHKKLKNNYFAVAANVFRDEAGDARLRTLNPNIGFAYHQKVTRKMKLSGGIQTGSFTKPSISAACAGANSITVITTTEVSLPVSLPHRAARSPLSILAGASTSITCRAKNS
jgi:type IX secretion system PorP/SprF family membrane protein